MASLNLSANGPSISKSYQSVVNAALPSGLASTSPTYGQWAVFSVTTPLVNAFQQDSGGKESVLKVQSTGEGELLDLIDEFSDGRVQFAFVKVKDTNTGLPKHVLVGWCGEGVPERTKGYFNNYQAATAKILHGYHVQITARSDRDLSPEGIVQKVADASGSKYSTGGPEAPSARTIPVTSKPAFMPTSSAGAAGYNPLKGSQRATFGRQEDMDEDGWGADAPPVTRTQLERVEPAYKPTRVNMGDLSQGKDASAAPNLARNPQDDRPEVVKGSYEPVGKVDIAALRREAQAGGSQSDDRPITVKGAYEPVGKVDIAAIRARAQEQPTSGVAAGGRDAFRATDETPKPLAERSTAFSQPERLTSLPKPKVSSRFAAGSGQFSGTKAPVPGEFGFDSKVSPKAAPAGASRTYADEGGKTPAQLWAEKKARQGGPTMPGSAGGGLKSPDAGQPAGDGEWKSGYAGKKWAAVQTTKTGQSASSLDQQSEEETAGEGQPFGGVGSIKDKFSEAPIIGREVKTGAGNSSFPPPLDNSTKPTADRGVPIPGLNQRPPVEPTSQMPVPPPPQPRSPTPPTPAGNDEGSPIRVAMPVSRADPEVENAREEQTSPPPSVPVASLSQEVSRHEEPSEADAVDADNVARAAATQMAASSFEQTADTAASVPPVGSGGRRALAQYDYEKAEDNELELREGEYVTNIDMVDEDWWMGQNSRGETGLFPSNYVELVEEGVPAAVEAEHEEHVAQESVAEPATAPATSAAGKGPATALALYDYEAGEDNELTFPEGAKITNVEFPDEDWWSGEYGGKAGLFPANYVQLDE